MPCSENRGQGERQIERGIRLALRLVFQVLTEVGEECAKSPRNIFSPPVTNLQVCKMMHQRLMCDDIRRNKNMLLNPTVCHVHCDK